MVLVGGPGIRLRPLTDKIPKALIEVAGKPLINWIIEWLKMNDVQQIVLGVAHLKEQIIDYLGDGSSLGVNIIYSVHTIEGGTGEGFRQAIGRYINEDIFFAMNGDQITNLNLRNLANFHLNNNPVATIALANPYCPYGHIKVDEHHDVLEFTEKPLCSYTHCNSGVYTFQREILDFLPAKGDIENTTFPVLASKRKLKAYQSREFFITVNTHKDLIEAEEKLKAIAR